LGEDKEDKGDKGDYQRCSPSSQLPTPQSLLPSLYLLRNPLENRTDFGTVKKAWITCPVKVANL
jgi:hypothetical protein